MVICLFLPGIIERHSGYPGHSADIQEERHLKNFEHLASLLTLKTRTFHPGLTWGLHPDGAYKLHWGSPDDASVSSSQLYRVTHGTTKRDVRKALSSFRKIARHYADGEDDQDLMTNVAQFATAYGSMWGEVPRPSTRWARRTTGESLADWKTEVLTFIDADDLHRTIGKGSYIRGLEKRVETQRVNDVVFRTSAGTQLTLSSDIKSATVQDPKDGSEQVVYPTEIAQLGGGRLNWMIFARLVESRLDGRLRLALDPSRRDNMAVTPTGIIPTIYARLLLDVLDRQDISALTRVCANPACEQVLPDEVRSDAIFCSDKCRKAASRRKAREARNA